MESGTCNTPEMILSHEVSSNFGNTFSSFVGCEYEDDEDDDESYLNCMRSLKTSDLLYGVSQIYKLTGIAADDDVRLKQPQPPLFPLMPFGPCIDGTTDGIPKIPLDAILDGEHNKDVPLLIGTNLNEGSIFVSQISTIIPSVRFPLDEADVIAALHHFLDSVVPGGREAVPMDELMNNIYNIDKFQGKVREQLSMIIRDYIFLCPSRRAVRAISQHRRFNENDNTGSISAAQAYLYQFTFKPRFWLDYKIFGEYPASELDFVFGRPYPRPSRIAFDWKDDKMVKVVQGYWLSFAHSGNPNNFDINPKAFIEWVSKAK